MFHFLPLKPHNSRGMRHGTHYVTFWAQSTFNRVFGRNATVICLSISLVRARLLGAAFYALALIMPFQF